MLIHLWLYRKLLIIHFIDLMGKHKSKDISFTILLWYQQAETIMEIRFQLKIINS
jgi:hypothetical protein